MIKVVQTSGSALVVGDVVIRPVGPNVTVTDSNLAALSQRATVLVAVPVADLGMGVL